MFHPLDQRGVTLTEVMIVGIIGTLVMGGLVAFYLSSQLTWLDASTQAITQREATFVTSTIADSVRKSGKAQVVPSPDGAHSHLALFHKASDATPFTYFYWNAADSSVHNGTSDGGDHGPMTQAKVRRFAVTATGTQVAVDLELSSRAGKFALTTQTVMINRP